MQRGPPARPLDTNCRAAPNRPPCEPTRTPLAAECAVAPGEPSTWHSNKAAPSNKHEMPKIARTGRVGDRSPMNSETPPGGGEEGEEKRMRSRRANGPTPSKATPMPPFWPTRASHPNLVSSRPLTRDVPPHDVPNPSDRHVAQNTTFRAPHRLRLSTSGNVAFTALSRSGSRLLTLDPRLLRPPAHLPPPVLSALPTDFSQRAPPACRLAFHALFHCNSFGVAMPVSTIQLE